MTNFSDVTVIVLNAFTGFSQGRVYIKIGQYGLQTTGLPRKRHETVHVYIHSSEGDNGENPHSTEQGTAKITKP